MANRRKFTAKFKNKVVLEALKERHTMAELAQKYELHPQQITTWKNHFLVNAESVFEKKKVNIKDAQEQQMDALLQTIGLLKVENDFLKKSLK